MATAFVKTYDQVGRKEEVSDIITILTPSETPALTMLGSEPTDNILYQWQEDTLDAPAANAQVDGADAPAANQGATTMRSNTTQIFAKTVKVSGSANASKMYGVTKEFARQMAKKGKEIKRDVEYALVQSAQVTVTGDNATARKFAGFQGQTNAGSKLANSGTPRALTENLVLTASQTAYTNGSDISVLMIKPADSLIVAGFAAATGRLREFETGERKITNVINIYESPFNTLKVVKNRQMKTTDAMFIDPSMWKLRPYRNWFTIDLAVTGDFTAKELIGEFGLTHRNWDDGIWLTDLS